MGLAVLIVTVIFRTLPVLSSQDEWRSGRATYYGEKRDGSNDGFSIHRGSCQFGSLDPNVGTGWDIAALPDVHPDYQGSCGRCYEIACEPMVFKDNYGESLDRTDACINIERSVIVTIVDVCPCNYPRNQYYNKRWCCGDMDHFDMSMYAFEKIGATNAGVIGIKYRPVPCPGADDMFASTPPEALTMPSFSSNGKGLSDIERLRKAIKGASGKVVISEPGQTIDAPVKPSDESRTEGKPSGKSTPVQLPKEGSVMKPLPSGRPIGKTSGDGKEPGGVSSTEARPDEKAEEKSLWRPVIIRPKLSGGPKYTTGTNSKQDSSENSGKDPSSVPASGPSIFLAAIIVVVHLMA